jgi:hypothetical protein
MSAAYYAAYYAAFAPSQTWVNQWGFGVGTAGIAIAAGHVTIRIRAFGRRIFARTTTVSAVAVIAWIFYALF